jgi:hypothetical protein
MRSGTAASAASVMPPGGDVTLPSPARHLSVPPRLPEASRVAASTDDEATETATVGQQIDVTQAEPQVENSATAGRRRCGAPVSHGHHPGSSTAEESATGPDPAGRHRPVAHARHRSTVPRRHSAAKGPTSQPGRLHTRRASRGPHADTGRPPAARVHAALRLPEVCIDDSQGSVAHVAADEDVLAATPHHRRVPLGRVLASAQAPLAARLLTRDVRLWRHDAERFSMKVSAEDLLGGASWLSSVSLVCCSSAP